MDKKGSGYDQVAPEEALSSPGGLVVEPKSSGEDEKINHEVKKSLDETEEQLRSLVGGVPSEVKGWHSARKIVEQFAPVPWFIWRIANFAFSRSDASTQIPEGMVMGLRRLLFAAASDPVLGAGQPINNIRKALSILPSDVIGAASVVHAICRKLAARKLDRIWRPIIDDALLRSQIGVAIGQYAPKFGKGRGMLAGFAGRAGLAVLLVTGDPPTAVRALEKLAAGEEIASVGIALYGCDPLQVSAMILTASGCGRDAACGTVSYRASNGFSKLENDEQKSWLSAFAVIEKVRSGHADQVPEEMWQMLGFDSEEKRAELLKLTKQTIRTGYAWHWIA